MKNYELPKLPEGYQYGEEMSFTLPEGSGDFRAPEGCIIKSIDEKSGQVICVPIQIFNEKTGTWVTTQLG